MEKLRFKGWVTWDDVQKYDVNEYGGLGGWFNNSQVHGKPRKPDGHTWADYLKVFDKKLRPYAELLKEKILSENLRITGPKHQDNFVPLFSDGTVSTFTYRSWGDLMAAIYSTKEKPLDYMEYYM